MSILPQGNSVMIREVWADNLVEEFALIKEIVYRYPYIAMDTEFPGIVFTAVGNFRTSSEFNYFTLKSNANILHLIQLGFTFLDRMETCPTTALISIASGNSTSGNSILSKISIPSILLSFCNKVVLISRKTMRRESMHRYLVRF